MGNMTDKLINKTDLGTLLKIYKKYGYDNLDNLIKNNSINSLEINEFEAINKVINISSNPIELIKEIYENYLELIGGKRKKGRKKKSKKKKSKKKKSKKKKSKKKKS